MIPKGVKKEGFERSSAVLELLAAKAHRYIAPLYFEFYIKRQYVAGDVELQKMFNIIRMSVVFDMGALYSNSLTVETLSDYVSPSLALRKVWSGDGTGDYADIETAWAMLESGATAKLDAIMSDLLDY